MRNVPDEGDVLLWRIRTCREKKGVGFGGGDGDDYTGLKVQGF